MWQCNCNESLQVASMRAQLGIRVSGFDAPKPVQSFEQCGFDSALLTVIKKSGYALQPALSLASHQEHLLPATLRGVVA